MAFPLLAAIPTILPAVGDFIDSIFKGKGKDDLTKAQLRAYQWAQMLRGLSAGASVESLKSEFFANSALKQNSTKEEVWRDEVMAIYNSQGREGLIKYSLDKMNGYLAALGQKGLSYSDVVNSAGTPVTQTTTAAVTGMAATGGATDFMGAFGNTSAMNWQTILLYAIPTILVGIVLTVFLFGKRTKRRR